MGTPSSPPDTPVAGSPKFSRAGPSFGPTATMAGRRASIPFLGGVGSQFAHGRRVRPEEISPRSSKSSDQAEDSEADSEKSSTLSLDHGMADHWDPFQLPRASSRAIVECDLEITECSEDGDDDDEFMDSDAESLEILQPSGFSSPASGRQSPTSGHSSSRPRADRELDPRMLHDFEDLACYETDESGSEENPEMSEYERNRKRMRLEKRQRRMTSGSLSKRTVSDRGSDEDREDLQPWDTGDLSQRRLRRKTDRWSLLSTQAPEIIIEVKEPHSDGEMSVDSEELLQELPFWRLIEGGDSE